MNSKDTTTITNYNYYCGYINIKKFIFRIKFRPDSWNIYSISQNATSKEEAIQYIITSLNEINSHRHDTEYQFYNSIDSMGPDTTTYESILCHYDFILTELHNNTPEVHQLFATEWKSALA